MGWEEQTRNVLLIDDLNLKVWVVALGDRQSGFVAFSLAQGSNGLVATDAVILVPREPTGEVFADPLSGRASGADEWRIPSKVLAEYVEKGRLAGTVSTGENREARMEINLDRVELAPILQLKPLKAHPTRPYRSKRPATASILAGRSSETTDLPQNRSD
jgi:hypothetical protein